jgi:hypothetical protein
MRKVKVTQDSFEEKLGAILTDFPMLDVRKSHLTFTMSITLIIGAGSTPFLSLSRKCFVRQEPLQTRPRSIENSKTLDRFCSKRLCPAAQIRRQLVQM